MPAGSFVFATHEPLQRALRSHFRRVTGETETPAGACYGRGMSSTLALVKGQTLKSLLLYAEKELTGPQYQQLLSKLSPDERGSVAHILPTSTYPVRLVNRLTVDAARIAGRPLPEFARAAGRFNATEGIKGVYRFFARMMKPDALLAKAATMWSTMNLAGSLSMKKHSERGGVLWLTDYPEPDEVMCYRITGWMEQILDLAGAKESTVTHTLCRARGGQVCEWQVTW